MNTNTKETTMNAMKTKTVAELVRGDVINHGGLRCRVDRIGKVDDAGRVEMYIHWLDEPYGDGDRLTWSRPEYPVRMWM